MPPPQIWRLDGDAVKRLRQAAIAHPNWTAHQWQTFHGKAISPKTLSKYMGDE
jgi:hypothetical protein